MAKALAKSRVGGPEGNESPPLSAHWRQTLARWRCPTRSSYSSNITSSDTCTITSGCAAILVAKPNQSGTRVRPASEWIETLRIARHACSWILATWQTFQSRWLARQQSHNLRATFNQCRPENVAHDGILTTTWCEWEFAILLQFGSHCCGDRPWIPVAASTQHRRALPALQGAS